MSDKIFLKDITLPIIETGENETYSFVQTDSDLETAGDAADAKKVGDELTQLKADFTQLDGKIAASLITNTASGSIASFPDGADGVPVKDLVVDIEPVQDLHGQSNPYPGGASVNKLNPETVTTGKKLNNVGEVVNGSEYCVSDWIPVEPNTNYCARRIVAAANGYGFCFYNANKEFLKYEVISGTTPVNGVRNSGADAAYARITVQLEKLGDALFAKSDTEIPYVPYSNICPISGWTGANVVRTGKNVVGTITDYNNEARIYGYSENGNYPKFANVFKPGTYALSVTAYTPQTIGNQRDIHAWFHRTSDQKWCKLNGSDAGNGTLIFPDIPNSVTTTPTRFTTTFVLPFECDMITLGYYFSGKYLIYSDIQLELASTATDYEVYKGTTINIDWTTEAGTVYGGTLTINQDGSVDLSKEWVEYKCSAVGGSTGWVIGGSGQASGGYYWASINGSVTPAFELATPTNGSEYGLFNYGDWRYGAITGRWRACIISSHTNVSIVITSDSDIRTQSGMNDFLATLPEPLQICYKLQTPVVYHLDSIDQITTLLGQNNIWADCGDTTVEYRADTKLYIENLTAPTEDDMVANTNIPDATYFMVGNTLLLSTTTIPAGDTINPGTNCTLMNLASALNALNS